MRTAATIGGRIVTGISIFWAVAACVSAADDKEGPRVAHISLTPNPNYGSRNIKIVARVDDRETGGSKVVAAEFSVGPYPQPAGQGIAMEGDFGKPVVTASGSYQLPESGPGSLEDEQVLFYVRGKDGAGNWGDPVAAVLFNRTRNILPAEYVYFTPNPCRRDTGYISFMVTEECGVTVQVFDLKGREIIRWEETVPPVNKPQLIPWDVSRVGTDVYIFRVTARSRATGEEATVAKKLAVIK